MKREASNINYAYTRIPIVYEYVLLAATSTMSMMRAEMIFLSLHVPASNRSDLDSLEPLASLSDVLSFDDRR